MSIAVVEVRAPRPRGRILGCWGGGGGPIREARGSEEVDDREDARET